VCRAARISGVIGGASAARAWGQRYSCTADPSLRPSRLVHPAAINHALGFVERVFLATARAYCNRRDRSVAVLDADQGSVLTFAFQQASAGGSCGETNHFMDWAAAESDSRRTEPPEAMRPRPRGLLLFLGLPSRRRVFVTLSCGRLRSKPMWTLTHPENRPCGYAGDMLRITPWTRAVLRN
jgi:hypothetical protein